MQLRDYQTDAIKHVYSSLRSNQSTVLQLPTGSGKTHIAMQIIKHGLKHGKRINFVVDRLTLLDQTLEKFLAEKIPFGVVQGMNPWSNSAKPVQIISVQTLMRKDQRNWPPCDLFLIDECHCQYEIITRIMSKWDNLKYIGLSATPFTRGLGNIWNDLVVGATTADLIEQGYLAGYVAYGPSAPDLSGVRRSGNDYSAPDLEERMNALTGDIVAHYEKLGNNGKALCFTPTVAYAQHLADEFNSNGIMADHVSGHDTDERRKRVLKAYRNGEIKVICNCEVLTKGFDECDIEVGILARPTRSLSLHIQMLGRFLRTAPGKDKAVILDHAGNIERLGFPDDPLPTNLDMGVNGTNSDTRQPDEPQPWNCPMCHSLVPPRTITCTVCGHTARRKHEVTIKDGVLELMKAKGMSQREQKQAVYSQLLHIADQHKFKVGWAANKYREMFDVWPRTLTMERMPPTTETQMWVDDSRRRFLAHNHIKRKYDQTHHSQG
jgi:superfamily II DNA or RNA helicase